MFGFDIEMLQDLKLNEQLRSEYKNRDQEHYKKLIAEANDETTLVEDQREAFYQEKHQVLPELSAPVNSKAVSYTKRYAPSRPLAEILTSHVRSSD